MEKQPTGPSPEGCVENGPAAAGSVRIDSDMRPFPPVPLGPPCRPPILTATTSPLYVRQHTKHRATKSIDNESVNYRGPRE